MMAKTKIEWADAVWNPVTGCTKISEGCRNCYAERMAKRLAGRYGYPAVDPFKVTLHPERLKEPMRWRKPRLIFVDSMGDLFHEDVPDDFINSVFKTWSWGNRRHILIVLTKRPNRMKQYFDRDLSSVFWNYQQNKYTQHVPYPDPRLWLGVSIENQETADERIPLLLQTSAAKRIVSIEPMLGAIDLVGSYPRTVHDRDWLEGDPGIDWVICGGETGPGARPMHPDWVRLIRDQCQGANVPFIFKSWGEWTTIFPQNLSLSNRQMTYQHETTFYKIGKKAAGRLLDGREWEEVPGGK